MPSRRVVPRWARSANRKAASTRAEVAPGRSRGTSLSSWSLPFSVPSAVRAVRRRSEGIAQARLPRRGSGKPPSMREVALLVCGGGPAALSAARGYRDAGGEGEVLVVSDDELRPYARPPLSKDYVRGDARAEDLPLEDEEWYTAQGVELLLQ